MKLLNHAEVLFSLQSFLSTLGNCDSMQIFTHRNGGD